MNTIEVSLESCKYNIYIKNGIKNRLKDYIDEYFKSDRKFVIFTDDNVYENYRNFIDDFKNTYKERMYLYVMRPGEGSKHISNIEGAYEFLVENNITRKDAIIALGGGVVGDFSGFIASTYMRGIGFIQVPTSLLSQVDSSVGGKVAVNLDSGKNLVGSFYQPELVIIDPEFLKTLESRVFFDGLAEVIKYGLILDEEIINILEKCNNRDEIMDNIIILISKSCSLKKDIVIEDEKENGLRAVLNFGHTIGHSIEKLGAYKEYSHGEAVGIGMIMMIESGIKNGICEEDTLKRVKNILDKFRLPVRVEYSNRQLLENMGNDKKFQGDTIKLVYIEKIGVYKFLRTKRSELGEVLFG